VGSSAEEFDLFGFALAASGAPGPTAATPAATPQSHTLRTRRASLTLRGASQKRRNRTAALQDDSVVITTAQARSVEPQDHTQPVAARSG
jgi:hypothetical protein